MDTLAKEESAVGTEPTFVVGSKLNPEGQYESHSNRAYTKLMSEFRAVWKDSAETFIKRAEILKKAKAELGENELDYTFEGFCEELGMKPRASSKGQLVEHSTVKKMLKIGKEASRFYPVLDQLPDNWTTLYELAKLDEDTFNQVIEDERFNPKMTAKVLAEICPPEPKMTAKVLDEIFPPAEPKAKKIKVLSFIIKVDLAHVDDDKKQEIHSLLQSLTKDFNGVEVKGDLTLLAA